MNFLEQHGYELKNPRALVRSPILTISSVAYSILHTFSVAYILICAHSLFACLVHLTRPPVASSYSSNQVTENFLQVHRGQHKREHGPPKLVVPIPPARLVETKSATLLHLAANGRGRRKGVNAANNTPAAVCYCGDRPNGSDCLASAAASNTCLRDSDEEAGAVAGGGYVFEEIQSECALDSAHAAVQPEAEEALAEVPKVFEAAVETAMLHTITDAEASTSVPMMADAKVRVFSPVEDPDASGEERMRRSLPLGGDSASLKHGQPLWQQAGIDWIDNKGNESSEQHTAGSVSGSRSGRATVDRSFTAAELRILQQDIVTIHRKTETVCVLHHEPAARVCEALQVVLAVSARVIFSYTFPPVAF